MVERTDLLGGAEIVGTVGGVVVTFTVGGFSADPLPWRVLAVFMGIEGLRKVSFIGDWGW